jgi:hypothetical protein
MEILNSRVRQAMLAIAAAAAVVAVPSTAHATTSTTNSFHVFSRSFVEDPATHTVSLPQHKGYVGGKAVTYVITDASTEKEAQALGVNFAPRLANARGTAAVQRVSVTPAGLKIPATVDFTPSRVVVPGPTGFPPAQTAPGAEAEPGYSSLLELPDGTVINAPQVANSTGRADKVVSISHGRVVYRETDGFYEHKPVHYVSFEASIPLTAAIENATDVPALNAAPFDTDSAADDGGAPSTGPQPAREEIGIVTNGQLGKDNPQRQGLSSALLDGLDPLNILGEVPENDPTSEYSPLWDANLAQWTPAAVAAGQVKRVTDFDDLRALADQGLITAPDGSKFTRSGFLINCPAIAIAD